MKNLALFLGLFAFSNAYAELRVPANTGYSDPNPDAARFSSKGGVTRWKGQSV